MQELHPKIPAIRNYKCTFITTNTTIFNNRIAVNIRFWI